MGRDRESERTFDSTREDKSASEGRGREASQAQRNLGKRVGSKATGKAEGKRERGKWYNE
jgi:hypothetical protein